MAYRGVVLDLDGTLYRHQEPVDGAVSAVERLRERDVEILFFSNDPRAGPAEYVPRLEEMGFAVDPDEVRSSASVSADYLADHHGGDDVYVLGSPGLRSLLVDRGLSLTREYTDPDVVLGSWTRAFDYEALMEAMWALEGGCPFLGTDPDVTVPIGNGRSVPGTGAILAALTSVSGRKPHILGKPSHEAARAATASLTAPPGECLVVGDRVDTDLVLGDRAGMDTALVLTGVTDRADLGDTTVTPDHVIDSVSDLPALLGEPG